MPEEDNQYCSSMFFPCTVENNERRKCASGLFKKCVNNREHTSLSEIFISYLNYSMRTDQGAALYSRSPNTTQGCGIHLCGFPVTCSRSVADLGQGSSRIWMQWSVVCPGHWKDGGTTERIKYSWDWVMLRFLTQVSVWGRWKGHK